MESADVLHVEPYQLIARASSRSNDRGRADAGDQDRGGRRQRQVLVDDRRS